MAERPYAPAALYPQKAHMVLISIKSCVNRGAIVRLEGSSKLIKFNDLIGTRTNDLPASSIAPQPSTLPHASANSYNVGVMYKITL
jgi:hypothetical protein